MIETTGQLLKRLRTAAGLSQLEVALQVGVTQRRYSEWERDDRPVPTTHVEPLTRVLGTSTAALRSTQTVPLPRGRPSLPRQVTLVECNDLPPYDIKGTFNEVVAISECASDIVASATRRLTRGALAAFLRDYWRDSPWELYIMFHLLAMDAHPARISLATQRCPLLAVEDFRSLRLATQQQRHVLVLERGDVVMLFTPQVWVVSPTQSEWYRLDFVCGVYDSSGTVRFADLEFDTSEHDTERDRRRARGICAPRIGVRAWGVDRFTFGPWLVEKLMQLLDTPEPNYRKSA